MRVEDLPAYLRTEWHAIREQRLDASYIPSPVREVRLPKPGGGTRMLGIPTVLDRFMTQAILQVLSPLFDPGFSDHSYGFRPGRSALHAAWCRRHRHLPVAVQHAALTRRIQVLATKKTSTMQEELREAGSAGFEFVGVTVASTRFGGDEVVAILKRPVGVDE